MNRSATELCSSLLLQNVYPKSFNFVIMYDLDPWSPQYSELGDAVSNWDHDGSISEDVC